jgi:hypothetical protein
MQAKELLKKLKSIISEKNYIELRGQIMQRGSLSIYNIEDSCAALGINLSLL